MTNAAKIAELNAQLEELGKFAAQYDFGVNEGGYGFNPHTAKIEQLAKELALLKFAAKEAAFAAEWTADVTAARRIEWNAFGRANATSQGLHHSKVTAFRAAHGWDHNDLRAAVALHNIK